MKCKMNQYPNDKALIHMPYKCHIRQISIHLKIWFKRLISGICHYDINPIPHE